MFSTERLMTLAEKMRESGLTQTVITDSDAIYYLTGEMQHCGERFLALLVKDNGGATLFLNKLFINTLIPNEEIVWFTDNVRGAQLVANYTDHSKPLGLDKNMRAEFVLQIMGVNAGSEYVNGSLLVDSMRAVKDEHERQLMINASILNDKGMTEIKKYVKEGVTEKELADKLLEVYLSLGADGFSFPPIVSFGAHAADPHHEPDDTKLEKNQCVLFDIGCAKDGYCADMTRTYYFGEPTEEEKKIYALVKKANESAEAMIKPGVRFCDIDAAARSVIEEAGYGEYFTHRLGHSIGREVHEYGDVSGVNENCVVEGMTFSCEPGIYLPGKYGVRIEDLCMVTADGVKILNSVSKEMESL
ncbi:MAG: Xaa-Pro peptidase family protein [Clostridia bacterium]|nr:Xaa-Pro peptidase family protein [Clostridia bacterium]